MARDVHPRNGRLGMETPPSPRDVIDASLKLGDDRVNEIVGVGGLSGATAAQHRQIIEEARKQ